MTDEEAVAKSSALVVHEKSNAGKITLVRRCRRRGHVAVTMIPNSYVCIECSTTKGKENKQNYIQTSKKSRGSHVSRWEDLPHPC
jgi:hypothetical protein